MVGPPEVDSLRRWRNPSYRCQRERSWEESLNVGGCLHSPLPVSEALSVNELFCSGGAVFGLFRRAVIEDNAGGNVPVLKAFKDLVDR